MSHMRFTLVDAGHYTLVDAGDMRLFSNIRLFAQMLFTTWNCGTVKPAGNREL